MQQRDIGARSRMIDRKHQKTETSVYTLTEKYTTYHLTQTSHLYLCDVRSFPGGKKLFQRFSDSRQQVKLNFDCHLLLTTVRPIDKLNSDGMYQL